MSVGGCNIFSSSYTCPYCNQVVFSGAWHYCSGWPTAQVIALLTEIRDLLKNKVHDTASQAVNGEADPYHDQGNGTNHRISQCTGRCVE